MRYIDSGSRDPNQALGTWLGTELLGDSSIAALRVQSGFFGSEALGYFEDSLRSLEQNDGHTRFLIGSNDGQTPREVLADLLTVAGQPRAGLKVGVVSFQTGFFHPKVFHFRRSDGSSTAYVGSANLTRSGTTSLHIEAGLILDSRTGDAPNVLDSIADAIDAWFSESRPGFYEVVAYRDLDALVQAHLLGVIQPPSSKREVRPVQSAVTTVTTPGHSLRPLVAPPTTQTTLPSQIRTSTVVPTPNHPLTPSSARAGTTPGVVAPPSKQTAAKHWGKKLTDSDAQRKKSGNQRGAITLVQGDYRGLIDHTTYFRNELFGQATWSSDTARTGQPIEKATIPMNVIIDGTDHGTLNLEVTNASNREARQNNYTAELHIEPIGAILRRVSISGKQLDIFLDASGEYWLVIA